MILGWGVKRIKVGGRGEVRVRLCSVEVCRGVCGII